MPTVLHQITHSANTSWCLCLFCPTRLRTCGCWCRRWRTGPTGCSPNCSLKISLTKWRGSATRRKCRWDEDVAAEYFTLQYSAELILIKVIIFLLSCGRLVSNGYDWTCHWHTRTLWVVRDKNTLHCYALCQENLPVAGKMYFWCIKCHLLHQSNIWDGNIWFPWFSSVQSLLSICFPTSWANEC